MLHAYLNTGRINMYWSGKRGSAVLVLQRYIVMYTIQDVDKQAQSFGIKEFGMVS